MWTLLLWLNQKIIKLYKSLQEKKEQHKRRQKIRDIHRLSKHLPNYLKRDMGLPPYDPTNKHDL